MKVLDLVLKGVWYDMIASGEKKEEYREIKMYWIDRLIDSRGMRYEELAVRYFWEDRFNPDLKTMKEDFDGGLLAFKGFTHIRFRRGYSSASMTFLCNGILIGVGVRKWGAPRKPVFIIKLGERV
jgi:hypothetical protein